MIVALLLVALALAEDGETAVEESPPPKSPPAAAELPLALELPRPRLGPPRQRRLGTTGFRTLLPAGNTATARVALVVDPTGPFIFEGTTRLQAGFRWASIAAEVAGTAGASELWSGAGFGNVLLDARFLFGGKVTLAVGVRGTLPAAGWTQPVAWWGTVPQATVPTYGFALATEGAVERWVWHIHVGGRTDAWWAYSYTFDIFDLDTSVATVQPIAGRWSLVAEAELLSNRQTPLHLRALARRDLGRGWTFDAGLALPLVAFLQDPTLQVLGSLGWRAAEPGG